MRPVKRPVASLGAKTSTPKYLKHSDSASPAQAPFTPAKPTAKSLPGAKKVADAKAKAKPAAGPKPPAQPPRKRPPEPQEPPQWAEPAEGFEENEEPVERTVKEPAKPRLGRPGPGPGPGPGQSKSTKSKPKSKPKPTPPARSAQKPLRPARPAPKRKLEPPEPEPQEPEPDWQEEPAEPEKWNEPWEEETWQPKPAKPARQPRPSGPTPPVHPPTRPSARKPGAPGPSALPAKAPPRGRQPWPSQPSSMRPARPTGSTKSTGSTAYAPEAEQEPETPETPEKRRPVAWIAVPDESALVQQGYYNQAPVVMHEAEYQELLSDSHDILYTLADTMYDDMTFQHDHDQTWDWSLFPEVGQCAKSLGYGEWALCIAICPNQSIFAVGMAGQQKKRLQAARLAMSVALAANQNTSDKKLRDAFQRSPAFVEFCQTAEVNVEDSVPSHPALASSQRHANRKWSKKSQGQVEQNEQNEQSEQAEQAEPVEPVEQWNSEGDEAAEWKNDWGKDSWGNGSWGNSSWSNGSWGKSNEKQWKNSGLNKEDEEPTSAYEAPEDEASKAYQEEVGQEAQEAEEETDETQAIERLIAQAEEEAKKLSEEDFEKMDDQADDEWKQDELQEPEPETQALEVPGEGYQEDEFEEVFEELEEAQQDAMGDTQQAEPEEDVQPSPPKRQRQETQAEPLKRETPHWLYVDQLPEKLQGFSNETLVLASDGSKKAMYTQADKALEAMMGDLAKEVICDDDPKWEKFPEVAEELKLLADQQECFTLAFSPTRCLWGVGVSMKGPARKQAAKLALAVLAALQMAELGEEIPDLSLTPAVADFLEEAQAAKDDLLHSSIRA